MKISRALVLNTTCLFALSACVTSGGPSIEQNQSLITNAALISQNSDCTELVRNIEQMDAIILQSSNAQKNQYGSSSDSLKGTKQTIANAFIKMMPSVKILEWHQTLSMPYLEITVIQRIIKHLQHNHVTQQMRKIVW